MKFYFLSYERMAAQLARFDSVGIKPTKVDREHDAECDVERCNCVPWFVIDLAQDIDPRTLS